MRWSRFALCRWFDNAEVVAFREDRGPWYVAVPLARYIQLVRGLQQFFPAPRGEAEVPILPPCHGSPEVEIVEPAATGEVVSEEEPALR